MNPLDTAPLLTGSATIGCTCQPYPTQRSHDGPARIYYDDTGLSALEEWYDHGVKTGPRETPLVETKTSTTATSDIPAGTTVTATLRA